MDHICPPFDSGRSGEFARDVREKVEEYFNQTGRSEAADLSVWLKSIILSVAYFGSYVLLLVAQPAWPLAWLLCVVMGLGLAGLGFSVAHDALHGAYSTNPRINRALALIFEALGGNGYAWRLSHNGAHHGLPNVSGHDDDVDVSPLLRLSPHSAHRGIHRFQHLFAFGLYALATLNWALVKDFAFFSRRKPRCGAPGPADWTGLLVGKLLFYGAMAAPFVVVEAPVWVIVTGLLTVHLVAGLTIGTVFQLAHAVEVVEHLPATDASKAKGAWAAHQLRTTSNFAAGNRLLGWYIGGLNYQVEHHLFPRICHAHYPAISGIVEASARRHGLPYNSIPTLGQALGAHYRMLRRLGESPASSRPV